MTDKERFIKTVLELMKDIGPKLSLNVVAKELKMSKKTIYKLYGNKRDVIDLVITYAFESVETQVEEIIGDTSIDIVDKIKQSICVYPEGNIQTKAIKALNDEYPDIYNRISKKIEDGWTQIFTLIQLAINEKKIKPVNLDNLRLVLTAISKDVLMIETDTQQEILEDCVNMVFEGLII